MNACEPWCICQCGQQGCGCHVGPWPPAPIKPTEDKP